MGRAAGRHEPVGPLARAHFLATVEAAGGDFTDARTHLDQAVAGLREAGQQDHLPRGLLARAELYRHASEWDRGRADLDEAWAIATRDPQGQMRLFMTHCHLEYARLALDRGRIEGGDVEPAHVEETRKHVESARVLIEETGYHRRDEELAELQERLRDCS